MAIAPIDLQTLYSQLENVSKTVAHQQQGTQLSNAIQQEANARRLAERNTAVQQLKQDKDAVFSVKDRRSSAGGQETPGKNKGGRQGDGQEPEDAPGAVRLRDPNLGRYVDISG